ncbi:N-formylglutamate amidohydrolase [Pacificoceanicola onchidii]|uniref:N-formylglutamate amidohydrolase n=1 Tax=Pacificoceanicola onchidii TaxID=2562685 RepID=UPI0010A36C5D|nr:N-formylglutamate amidohydrolase [Pacificoceanicola onchidii]
MDALGWPSVAVMGKIGATPLALVCEHASAFIPPALAGLGLSEEAKTSHAAWDIGALDLAKRLSVRLSAPLVAGQISRLVYDCNRPLEAPGSIPNVSEVHAVPGNQALTAADRQARFDAVHEPFHAAVADVLDRQLAAFPGAVALITVHTFTPVFHGQRREVEIGFLHHADARLAKAAVAHEAQEGQMKAALNAPYSASDGVTYTLQKHADSRGLRSVMIEVRNDLVDTPAKAETVADHLAQTLMAALSDVPEVVQ